MIESDIEEFPTCVGCRYYVRYECTGEPEDLETCYRGGDDFTSSKFDKWLVKLHGYQQRAKKMNESKEPDCLGYCDCCRLYDVGRCTGSDDGKCPI